MRLRLALIVLVLVILPTAVLSILAGRTLRSSELIVRRELEVAAVSEIEDAASAAVTGVTAQIEPLRNAVSATAVRGGSTEIGAAVEPIVRTSDLVARVFVFVNPWGFLYPEVAPDELASALRREIASATSGDTPVVFSVGDRAYCFGALDVTPPMHVGFEADVDALAFLLVGALASAPDDKFVYRAVRPDGLSFHPGKDAGSVVLVDDPLGIASAAEPSLTTGTLGDEGPIVSVPLGPPFAAFSVAAYFRDADQIRRAERLRSQLFAWGILVLAMGVCVGGWIVVKEATLEIRRARSRSDFVIGVSHDLRTPVSSMKMLAETMYMGRVADPAKRREFLGTMMRECERLNHLVERVLFFVRFGQGALQYSLTETDPGDLVRNAVRVFGARFEGALGPSVPEIVVSAAERLPPVCVDESAITQVLLNLLDNAEKYSRRQVSGFRFQVSESDEDPDRNLCKDGDCDKYSDRDSGKDGEKGVHTLPLLPSGERAAPTSLPLPSGESAAPTSLPLPSGESAAPTSLPLPSGERVGVRGQRTKPPHAVTGHGPRIEIEIDTLRRRNWMPGSTREWVRITVRDHGMGMDRRVLRRVFREFYRAPGARDKNLSGTGLGLALCRHVVRAHGGRTKAESTSGEGSTFTVLLPVRRET